MEITQQQKNRLLAAADIVQNGELAVIKKIIEFQDTIEEKINEIEEKKNEVDVKVNEALATVDTKLSEVVSGKTPQKGEDYFTEDEIKQFKKDVTPVKGIDYKDGYIPVKGRDYFDGVSPDIDTIIYESTKGAEERLKPFIPTLEEVEKDLIKLTPEIKNELESLPQEEKLTIDAIKDLRKELDDLKKIKQNNNFMGGLNGLGARELVKDIDLSAQLDGVTTTFNIQAIWNVVSVSLSSYPYGSLRKNIDYTWTPTSITFTSEIDPATQLSAGQKCILTVVQA